MASMKTKKSSTTSSKGEDKDKDKVVVNEENYPLHCKSCNTLCPVDIYGQLHGNRSYCPPCFVKSNPGKQQPSIPTRWEHRCSWEFLQKFPNMYAQYYKNLVDQTYGKKSSPGEQQKKSK